MTSSHTNPDERDLLDFADAVAAGENLQPQSDLERTYLHVQHAMQGESGAIPADVKQSTWEDVMSTLSLAPEAPVSNRTRRERVVQAPTRRSRPKRIQWTPMQQTPKVTRRHFPLLAAVLLVFAIIGASFSTLVSNNDQVNNRTSVPPLAPLPLITNQTQIGDQTCAFNRQPLIFQANSFPMDELSVIQTDSGDLKFYCPETGDKKVLAHDVVSVEPTGVPETLLLGIRAADRPEYEPARHALLNLSTGKVLDVVEPRSDQHLMQDQFSPWFISNQSKDTNDLLLTDLRSLDSHSIEAPAWLDDNVGTSAYVTAGEDGQVTAIVRTGSGSHGEHSGELIGLQEEIPQILIIRNDFADAEWIDVPDLDGPVTRVSMSPNGSFIAIGVESNNNNGNPGDVTHFVVLDIQTGEEIGRTQDVGPFLISSAQWSLDSTNFMYTTGDTLGTIDVTSGQPERVVLQADGGVDYLVLTQDSNIVLVNIQTVQAETISSLYRVNIDSGDSVRLGKTGPRVFADIPDMRVPIIGFFDGTSYTIADAATGEVIDRWVFEGAPATPAFDEESVSLLLLGNIPFVTHHHANGLELWIWDYQLEPLHLNVPKLPTDINNYQLRLVGDGRYIVIQEYREPINLNKPLVTYILDSESPTPTWVPVE